MAKKRKVSSNAAEKEPSTGWNDQGGKLRAVNTYEDIADAEDEFHANRDKIMLDDGPDAKRRRKWQEEDALLEPSDEEVLGYSSDSEEDDVIDDEAANPSGEEEPNDEDEDAEGWGSSKKDYYNNDNIETEADALEEEEEARRLQKKRLEKMTDADFGLDEMEWDTWNDAKNDDARDVITEVLGDIKISPDMGSKERLNILQARYPELESLADELLELQPVLNALKKQAESQPTQRIPIQTTPTVVKARALAGYISSLAMYFAILTSPAKTDNAGSLDPLELRDHAVMDSLLRCRQLWMKAKSLSAQNIASRSVSVDLEKQEDYQTEDINDAISIDDGDRKTPQKKKQKSKRQVALEAASASVADLESLIPRRTKKVSKPTAAKDDDDSSDFGEETILNAKDAAAKASRRKNLNFYTSQIAQKSNKRGEKSREAGGDMDLPHKERLRDRQARLNAEAEARGKQLDLYGRGQKGVALDQDDNSGEDEEAIAKEIRGDEDEYYDMVSKNSKQRKEANEEHRSAIRQAKEQNSLLRVVEGDMDEEGKRAIGYVIEKNKGLAPKRKKDVRNPRVKKRKKFEEKKKKLSSMRAVYKGGEERGGYGGEKTGIKTGLVKSIKL